MMTSWNIVTSMIIPDELVEEIIAGRCIPFVGAGLSKAAGLPLWDELIEDMKKELIDRAREEGEEDDIREYLDKADHLA